MLGGNSDPGHFGAHFARLCAPGWFFFGSHLSQTKSQVPWQCPSPSHLSVEGDGAGLALGADPLGPGRVSLTPRLDLTADVLQGYKLPSGRGEGERREG